MAQKGVVLLEHSNRPAKHSVFITHEPLPHPVGIPAAPDHGKARSVVHVPEGQVRLRCGGEEAVPGGGVPDQPRPQDLPDLEGLPG